MPVDCKINNKLPFDKNAQKTLLPRIYIISFAKLPPSYEQQDSSNQLILTLALAWTPVFILTLTVLVMTVTSLSRWNLLKAGVIGSMIGIISIATYYMLRYFDFAKYSRSCGADLVSLSFVHFILSRR